MATHGCVGEFSGGSETWVSYIERLQQYFIANDIKGDDKQRAVLLSICGASTYQLIRSVVSPNKLTEKTFDQIVTLMKEHYFPKPSVTMQRFAFNSRSRKQGESVATFVADLRRLSEYCEFGDSLVEMLRDRLICGINNDRMQRRLLAESKLSFEKAYELAQAMETADHDARELQGPPTTAVNKLNRGTGRSFATGPRPTIHKNLQNNCYRCGGKHSANDCRFRQSECRFCKKVGHIERACRSKLKQDQRAKGNATSQTHNLSFSGDDPVNDSGSKTPDEYSMYNVRSSHTPIMVELKLNGAPISMELDTGAGISIVQKHNQLWPESERPPLQTSTVHLKTYTGEKLPVLGVTDVVAEYQQQSERMQLHIVDGKGPSLFGRDWLQKIKLDWCELHHLSGTDSKQQLDNLLSRHSHVFKDELGLIKGTTAKLAVDTNAQPCFCNFRSIPFSLRSRVEQQLDYLQNAGVIEPIQFSDWAAPIVPVVKPNGRVRICGDFKLTVNKVAKLDTYPLPKIDDLFSQLADGKRFSKLDLAHAYLQIALDDESKQYVVINTHKGLYRYNRLPFGIHSAPAIFQRTMENILRGIPHVSVYIDDILVTGTTESEHLQTLDKVLTQLHEAGVRLRRDKCAFMLKQVDYLGHSISAEGLKPSKEKIRAISQAPAPANLAQLRSFLGMVNYYGKFLKGLSSMLAPLYALLQKNQTWKWGQQQKDAFAKVKQELVSPKILIHYEPQRKLLLSCDASPYGIGAVISHVMDDGCEKPIAYTSRSLSAAEQNYAQIDKEGLAIVYGVKKFHHYLYGRQFTIVSDHRPLQHLFSETKSILVMASARIQRWALTLSAYNYTIQYRPGKQLANADLLSRLPLADTIADPPLPGEMVLLMEALNTSPIIVVNVKTWTNRDPFLSRVKQMILQGWPKDTDAAFQPYIQRSKELTVQNDCVLWGSRVVIPEVGRGTVMTMLHDGHPGMTRMKAIARGVVWWPGIDAEIEKKVKECHECQVNQKSPTTASLHPWEWPSQPWSRLHIDFAGPFEGKMFLVVADSHSKWLDVIPVSNANSTNTIRELRKLFATHGIPDVIVSDNGTAFTSTEFSEFMAKNGVKHLKTAPYHPATNGLAERAVQTFKTAMKKSASEGNIDTRLARFLFHYRTTPNSTTGVSPAELLMGRKLKTHLDKLRPNLASIVYGRQQSQVMSHDKQTSERTFYPNDPVLAKNYHCGPAWLPGEVLTGGPRNYKIKLSNGIVVRRHVDQMQKRPADSPNTIDVNNDFEDFQPSVENSSTSEGSSTKNTSSESTSTLRRSTRNRQPPNRYTPVTN